MGVSGQSPATLGSSALYREAVANDLPLIFDSWLKDFWNALGRHPYPRNHRVGALRLMPRDVYNRGQRSAIARALASSEAMVACVPSDPDTVYGWVCGGNGVLHYVYVKEAFRRDGIGNGLLTSVGLADAPTITVSHVTDWVDAISQSRKIVFDPYLLQG